MEGAGQVYLDSAALVLDRSSDSNAGTDFKQLVVEAEKLVSEAEHLVVENE